MNLKVFLTLIITIVIASTCFAAGSTVDDFNINNTDAYCTSRSVTLYHTITADTNCEMCFSEDSNAENCSSKTSCTTGTTSFTLSSSDATKTVYAFVYDNLATTSSDDLSDTIILDTTKPVCSITSPTTTDLNTNTVDFTFTCTGASSTLGKIDSNVITSGTSLSTYLIANTVHTITLDANDAAGNIMTQITMDVIYDTNSPTTGSISADSTWTNSDTPTFNISATHHSGTSGLKMAFSCTNANGDTNWTDWITYATSYTDFNINKSTYGCITSDWNNTIYIKFKDAAGNIGSGRYKTTQFYDIVDPSEPTSLGASAGNAKVTLTWDTPDADDRSGNESLNVYMKTGSGSYSLKTNVSDENDTSKEITSLTNGTAYCFKMTTLDRAGNESDYSSEQCATPAAANSTISIHKNDATTNIDYAKNGDVINIDCSYSASVSGAKIKSKEYSPTNSEETLEDKTSSTTSLDYDYTVNFSNPQDRVTFWCEATGASDSSIKTVYIDNNAPIISWIDTNDTFVGVRKVAVKASDGRALDRVTFDFNKTTIASTKDSNLNHYFDLNSVKYENGEYALKATAYDKAGNKTEITRTITALNTLTPKQKAQKAIDQAKAEQIKANEIIAYFDREGLIVPVALTSKKTEADGLIASATPLVTTNPESALAKATSALTLLQEFNKTAVVETINTKVYNYDSNTLLAQLKNAGVSESNILLISQEITSAGIERKLLILKAGSESMRQAKIIITFTNDTNSDVVKIIEIIPKEFVDSAKKIISDQNFRIVKEDPVIEFTVNAPKGTKATFSYGIGEITTAQATSITDNNILQKFSAPPLLTDSNSKAENIVQDNNILFFIAIIFGGVIFFLIILIIIAVLFFIKFSHPKHGFGEGKTLIEHLTPEQEAEKKKWEANK